MASSNELQKAAFHNPKAVARHGDWPGRPVPGFEDMQRMATLLLSERVGSNSRFRAVGAEGGLKLKTFLRKPNRAGHSMPSVLLQALVTLTLNIDMFSSSNRVNAVTNQAVVECDCE
jgi:hypothetical protein